MTKALAYVAPASTAPLEELKPGDTLTIESTGPKPNAYLLVDIPALREKKEPIGTIMADVVQEILNYIDQMDRTERRQRLLDGMAAAKARGVRHGRPTKKSLKDFSDVVNDYEQGKITMVEALEQTGFKKTTFYSRLKEFRKDQVSIVAKDNDNG